MVSRTSGSRLLVFHAATSPTLREFYDFAAKLPLSGSRRVVTADLFDGV